MELHFVKRCRKVFEQVDALERLKKMLPLKQERTSVLHLSFPNLIPSTSQCKTGKKVNVRALRFVFNEKQTHYQEVFNEMGLPSLISQRLAKMVRKVFKATNYHHAA